MKRLLIFLLCFVTFKSIAQQAYTIEGKTYELKTELSGAINLLWNTIDGQYRYFVKKGETIIELTNTKDPNNRFQEEYRITLSKLTSDVNLSADKVKFTLSGLRDFIDEYNAAKDPDYTQTNKAELDGRLLFFGGITNSPFIDNPENRISPLFGFEIEIFEAMNLPRHALYFHVKHTAKTDSFKYSNLQFGLGYRFRFINSETFNIYGSLTATTYNFINTEDVVADQVIKSSDHAFDAPLSFGIGADFKISDHSFITLIYDELFAIKLENQGNFSTHIAIGYKFNL